MRFILLILLTLIAGCATDRAAKVQAVPEPAGSRILFDNAVRSIEGNGKDYPARVLRGMEQLKSLAVQGYAPAQFKLAYFYYTGPASYDCLRQDTEQAYYWFGKAAAQNHREAQYELAMLFSPKSGLKRYADAEKHVYWMQKAADAGYPKAQYALGRMNEKGEFVPQDVALAKELFEKAAAQGDAQARRALQRFRE
jgi:TPR repeat protein